MENEEQKIDNQQGNGVLPCVSGSYSTVDIDKTKESGNKMDKMGKIFRKTKDGRPCYYSELSYFESNDL